MKSYQSDSFPLELKIELIEKSTNPIGWLTSHDIWNHVIGYNGNGFEEIGNAINNTTSGHLHRTDFYFKISWLKLSLTNQKRSLCLNFGLKFSAFRFEIWSSQKCRNFDEFQPENFNVQMI